MSILETVSMLLLRLSLSSPTGEPWEMLKHRVQSTPRKNQKRMLAFAATILQILGKVDAADLKRAGVLTFETWICQTLQ